MSEPRILDKVTMVYVGSEDRMKMQAQIKGGDIAYFWLTQRMCKGLVPVMIKHIEDTVDKEVTAKQQFTSAAQADSVQSFYQDRAMGQRGESTPVETVPEPDVEQLVVKMDVSRDKKGIILKIPTQDGSLAVLPLNMIHARQWLSILYTLFVQASWPLEIWPDWVKDSVPKQKSAQTEVILH